MEDDAIKMLQEIMVSANYFNISQDDYMNKISDIYGECLCQAILKFKVFLDEQVPEFTEEQRVEHIIKIHELFLAKHDDQFNGLEQYLSTVIFRIPKHVKLPKDKELVEKVEKFSKEDFLKMNQKVKELQVNIDQKVNYARVLKDRLDKFEAYEEHVEKLEQLYK